MCVKSEMRSTFNLITEVKHIEVCQSSDLHVVQSMGLWDYGARCMWITSNFETQLTTVVVIVTNNVKQLWNRVREILAPSLFLFTPCPSRGLSDYVFPPFSRRFRESFHLSEQMAAGLNS